MPPTLDLLLFQEARSTLGPIPLSDERSPEAVRSLGVVALTLAAPGPARAHAIDFVLLDRYERSLKLALRLYPGLHTAYLLTRSDTRLHAEVIGDLTVWLFETTECAGSPAPNVLRWDPTRGTFQRFLLSVGLRGVALGRIRDRRRLSEREGELAEPPEDPTGGLLGAVGEVGSPAWEAQEGSLAPLLKAVLCGTAADARAACPGLTDRQVWALQLRYRDGARLSEIAAKFACNPYDLHDRALKALRACADP